MSQSHRCALLGTLILLSPLSLVEGGDGAVPIWEPTVITESGSYVVTRSISAVSGPIIVIAANDVSISLNGFALSADSGAVISASSVSGLSVSNGFIIGSFSTGIDVQASSRVVLEDLQIEREKFSIGIRLSSTPFTLQRIKVDGNPGGDAVIVNGSDGLVEECQVRASCSGESAIHVIGSNNVVRHCAATEHCGTAVGVIGNRNLVVDNTADGPGTGGTGLLVVGDHNIVRGNRAKEGLDLNGNDNHVHDNIADRGFYALEVRGSRNLIENNLASLAGGWGLRFSAASSDNIYRGNVVRGNNVSGMATCTGPSTLDDFCDEGTGNTSGGGNFVPSAQ